MNEYDVKALETLLGYGGGSIMVTLYQVAELSPQERFHALKAELQEFAEHWTYLRSGGCYGQESKAYRSVE